MDVAVLVLDQVFDLGLSAVLDTLTTAGELAQLGGGRAQPRPRMVGLRRHVATQHGLTVPVTPARDAARPDVVVVPALGCKVPDTLRAALGRKDVHEAGELLRGWSRQGTLLAAACTGTFVLAAGGLLDHGPATTTWWLVPLFRELYPRVDLDESRMIVEARGRVTAGAALAHLDLALWLVRRRSPTLAAQTARYLMVDARPSQAAFAIPDQLAHDDPVVERFERWARAHLADFSLAAAARAAGTSERTLARRLHDVLGKTPLGFVQELRVERAAHLLQSSSADVDSVAAEVGYQSGVTLRTLLRRKLGRGVRELRRAR